VTGACVDVETDDMKDVVQDTIVNKREENETGMKKNVEGLQLQDMAVSATRVGKSLLDEDSGEEHDG
jgi:hypothetical protein